MMPQATPQARPQATPQATPQAPSAPPPAKGTPTPDRIVIIQDGAATIPAPPGTEQVIGVPAPDGGPGDVPERAMAMGITFFIITGAVIILLPLVRALARRMDRQGALPARTDQHPETAERLARIEHAVDSIALEVERISEGQRFTTKLLAERPEGAAVGRHLGQG